MAKVSPILNKIKQQDTNKTFNIQQQKYKVDIKNAKLKTLEKDSVELQNKSTGKQAALAPAALSFGSVTTIFSNKITNLSKAERELTALYDIIFDDFQKNTPEFLDFEKPKLQFGKLNELGGGYFADLNIIHIDPKDLVHTCILKDLQSTNAIKLSDSIEILDDKYRSSRFEIIRKGLSKEYRMATKNEALAMQGAVMSHELTHAQQFQILLSSEGGKEKYIEYLKSMNKDIPENILKKAAPFLYNYMPKKILSQDEQILEKLPDGNGFKYNIKHITDAFINYNDKNKLKYYTNLTEISAINGEYAYWDKVIKGTLPKPEGVSDEFLKSFRTKAKYNAVTLMRAICE